MQDLYARPTGNEEAVQSMPDGHDICTLRQALIISKPGDEIVLVHGYLQVIEKKLNAIETDQTRRIRFGK